MSLKTDDVAKVGKHAFEVAGLGLAPFRFVGMNENRITYPDGTSKAGGSCDYCGTGIALQCWVRSSDGKEFKVGCDCIRKVGDEGLLKAYKNSPEYRAHQRELKRAKDAIVFEEFKTILANAKDKLSSLPHPMGFTNRETGQPLTALDWAQWMFDHCGASGRASVLRRIKQLCI